MKKAHIQCIVLQKFSQGPQHVKVDGTLLSMANKTLHLRYIAYISTLILHIDIVHTFYKKFTLYIKQNIFTDDIQSFVFWTCKDF